jgi:ACT domain-containing protein
MYGITIDVMSSVCDRLGKTNEVLLYLQFVMEDRSFFTSSILDIIRKNKSNIVGCLRSVRLNLKAF